MRSGASRSRVVACAIDASNRVGALIKGVVPPWGTTVVAWRWWLRARVWHVIGTYLDGRNGVGKIPPGRCRRHVLGGRNVVPNACILPCESRSATTCSRGAWLGRGVGLRVGIYGVLSELGMIVPCGSRVVGVHRWSLRQVLGIIGIDRVGVGLSDCT